MRKQQENKEAEKPQTKAGDVFRSVAARTKSGLKKLLNTTPENLISCAVMAGMSVAPVVTVVCLAGLAAISFTMDQNNTAHQDQRQPVTATAPIQNA